jgi:hypothetical protein
MSMTAGGLVQMVDTYLASKGAPEFKRQCHHEKMSIPKKVKMIYNRKD